MPRVTKARRPAGSEENPVRSVRVGDALWEKAKRRATYEGVTMSHVLYEIVEGYANGYVDLPKIQVIYRTAENAQSTTPPPVAEAS